MSTQGKWRRFFAILLGILIWAATVALLEVCLFVFLSWKLETRDDSGFLATIFWSFVALPVTGTAALFVALFVYVKVMKLTAMRQDG
jgi:hypothetical protein